VPQGPNIQEVLDFAKGLLDIHQVLVRKNHILGRKRRVGLSDEFAVRSASLANTASLRE
jgi:hypothetical protein